MTLFKHDAIMGDVQVLHIMIWPPPQKIQRAFPIRHMGTFRDLFLGCALGYVISTQLWLWYTYKLKHGITTKPLLLLPGKPVITKRVCTKLLSVLRKGGSHWYVSVGQCLQIKSILTRFSILSYSPKGKCHTCHIEHAIR